MSSLLQILASILRLLTFESLGPNDLCWPVSKYTNKAHFRLKSSAKATTSMGIGSLSAYKKKGFWRFWGSGVRKRPQTSPAIWTSSTCETALVTRHFKNQTSETMAVLWAQFPLNVVFLKRGCLCMGSNSDHHWEAGVEEVVSPLHSTIVLVWNRSGNLLFGESIWALIWAYAYFPTRTKGSALRPFQTREIAPEGGSKH